MEGTLPEKELCFATEFVDWILSGKKKATTRIDHFLVDEKTGTYEDVGDFQVGDTFCAIHDGDDDETEQQLEPFAVLLVTNVEKRSYGSLDDVLAQTENFPNRKALCDALGTFYKDLQNDTELVVIYFELLRPL